MRKGECFALIFNRYPESRVVIWDICLQQVDIYHTVMVNTGGFSPAEEKAIEQRALTLGAASHKTVNAVDTYYEKGIKYLIFGNILKNATYPLSVSSERVFQALEVLKHVKEIGAGAVAHGSTGAGKAVAKPHHRTLLHLHQGNSGRSGADVCCG